MRVAGITLEENCIKIARFSKIKGHLTLESLEELPADQFFQDKNVHLVTGLGADVVIRRDIDLKLKRRAVVLKALPFQLENLLPFALEESIVYPFFFPHESGTDAIVFATTHAALQSHLEQLNGIDPDQISCIPQALSRWARLLFPHEKLLTLIDKNAAIALEGEKIVFSQSFEDKNRIEVSIKSKFGHFFKVGEEGPSFQGYSYEQLRSFAIPIGLGLEGIEKNSCQFRQGDFISLREKRMKKLLMRGSLMISLGLAVFIGGIGGWILHAKDRSLHKKIEGSTIAEWQQKLAQEARVFQLKPNIPIVKDVLAWLGGIQEPIEIVQFRYSLVQYPKAGEKEELYNGKVDLEFKAENPAIARRFKEALEQVPTFINKKQKISWTAEQNSYKISFELQRN